MEFNNIILKIRYWFHTYRNRYFRSKSEAKNFKNMSNAQIFDKIYSEKLWGHNEEYIMSSGEGSHKKNIINPYIDAMNLLLSKIQPLIIVDLGCGDFNVSKNFVSKAKTFIACDVSEKILSQNQTKFKHFNNLKFELIDISNDPLPGGDIAFIRQVLQHLSNDSIKKFVNYINKHKPYKHLVVTEHLPANKYFKSNFDKPSGPNTRLKLNSGVILHENPFLLNFKSYENILETFLSVNRSKIINNVSLIKTTIYNF